MSPGRWYEAGRRFSCRRCGACCTGAPGHVWLDAAESAAIAARLGLPVADFLARHARRVEGRVSLREEADGRCVLFESGRGCIAYEQRPRQCRTWPFWAGNLASPAAWERTAAGCPGMGTGEIFDAGRIDALAQSPGGPDGSRAA